MGIADSIPATAFAAPWESTQDLPAWMQDHRHLVVYSSRGVVRVDTADGAWVLPAQHAAWFPAQTRVRLSSDGPAQAIRVLLGGPWPTPDSRTPVVFSSTSLLRELFQLSIRWESATEQDVLRDHVFATIAGLVAESASPRHSYCVPAAHSPELAAAMEFARNHLRGEPSIEEAARTAGISPRTLARRFRDETGTTWRGFVHDARMLRAIELLATPGRSVAQTATEVGFQSMGAFTRAFVDYTGERPRDYHRRLTTEVSADA